MKKATSVSCTGYNLDEKTGALPAGLRSADDHGSICGCTEFQVRVKDDD